MAASPSSYRDSSLTCCHSAQTRADVRRLCALCIGELGAIDPAHLSVEVHIATPRRFLSEKDFSLWLIESLLIRAIRSATAIQQQNRASFSVQEILRVHGVDEDTVRIASRMMNKGAAGIRGMRKGELGAKESVDFWMALSEPVRETILPCVTSNYELSTPVVRSGAAAGEVSVKVEESKVEKMEVERKRGRSVGWPSHSTAAGQSEGFTGERPTCRHLHHAKHIMLQLQ